MFTQGQVSVGNRCHGGCGVGRLLTSLWCFTGWIAAQDVLVVSKAWKIGHPVGNSDTHLPGGDETKVLVIADAEGGGCSHVSGALLDGSEAQDLPPGAKA